MDSKKCEELNKECGVRMFGSVTVGTKGQVVIPKEVREVLDISPGDTLVVVTKHNKAIGMVKTDDMEAFMEYIQKEMGK
ncbi:MAG: Transcriptional regulator [uncultured bacterium (gcode 4)]|uniref:Transcriptional regulator n=1 Tax=uncultured bacterium (gcode 4) TaxID=1234023 RepID=K1YAD3_9BACT|nr:MAG: Transcriptional regulator [uncultured bacterium (gcode 4)]